MFAGYKKTFTTRVIRTRHDVSFKLKFSASSIKLSLSNVPDGASLVDMDIDDDGVCVLTFSEEKEE